MCVDVSSNSNHCGGCGIKCTVSHGSAYAAWDLIKNKKAEGLASLEIPGASERRQNAFISKFNAPLIYNFTIARNDLKGRIGGGMYRNLIKVRI